MPHDGEGGFEARGQCLAHVSLYVGQKVVVDVDVVLGRYTVACGVEHTFVPSERSSANYSRAAEGGTHVGPAELLEEPIMFGGAALENFPARKRKKKFWFHVGKILRTKLSEQAEPHPIPPPHYKSPKPHKTTSP